jgi:hypothetical protein
MGVLKEYGRRDGNENELGIRNSGGKEKRRK